MKKAATGEKVTTTANDEVKQYLLAKNAKSQFLGASLDMGWRLALTVLVPLFIGARVDDHFHSAPTYTVVGLFIALGGAYMVVWKTLKGLSQNDESKKRNKD